MGFLNTIGRIREIAKMENERETRFEGVVVMEE